MTDGWIMDEFGDGSDLPDDFGAPPADKTSTAIEFLLLYGFELRRTRCNDISYAIDGWAFAPPGHVADRELIKHTILEAALVRMQHERERHEKDSQRLQQRSSAEATIANSYTAMIEETSAAHVVGQHEEESE